MDLEARIESLLFVSDRAVTVGDLAAALDATPQQTEQALETLRDTLQNRGLRVQRHGQRLQLVSAPEAGPDVERFLGLDISGKLSPAALETLAIVAYMQPTTRIRVDAIRGVNSDSVLRSLVRRGLIEELGRADTVGRPILYGVTFEFLQQFGLENVENLPAREQLIAKLEDEASGLTASTQRAPVT